MPETIKINKMSSPNSRLYQERLAGYDILEPTEWQKKVIEEAAVHLNEFREKYGGKNPIPEDHIKLRIVATDNLAAILGEDITGSDTGGFLDDTTGEIYVAGDYNDMDSAHIAIHEMVHYFTGKVDRHAMSNAHMEAMTDFVATEIQARIFAQLEETPYYIGVNGEAVQLDSEEEILELISGYYNSAVYGDEKESLMTKDGYDYEGLKEILFSGNDYVAWALRATKEVEALE